MTAPRTAAERNTLAGRSRSPWPVSSITAWDVDTVKAALDEHERGNFSQSALLVDYMGRDDRLPPILDTLTYGIVRLPFSMRSSDEGDGRRAESVAAEFERQWFDTAPEPVQIELVEWLAMIGVAIGQNRWDRHSGRVYVQPWHMAHIRCDEHAGKWLAQARGGEIEIKPGDGEWVLLSLGATRGWMRGAVRRLAQDWLMRQFAKSALDASNEMRSGLRKAIVPADADDADKARFTASIANMGSETTVECSKDANGNGWDVEFDSGGADASRGIITTIKLTSTDYAVALLGQDMAIEAPGVYVPSKAYGKIQQDRIQTFSKVLETGFRGHVAAPWAAYNYDDARLAPWPTYDAEPPGDKQAEATLVQTLDSAGWETDEAEMAARFGRKLKRKPPKAQKTAPAQGQGQAA